MARRPPETLDDLLLANGESYSAFAARSGVPRFTLQRLRRGGGPRSPHVTTIAALAKALGVPPERVRAAIAASRQQQ